LRRAVGTASAIADVARLPGVELDARWREADVGLAEGRTFAALSAIAPAVAAALADGELDVDWPGGETHASLANRVAAAWADLLADGRPVVVVTHAGPLMHACAAAEGRGLDRRDLLAPATARRIEVVAGSTVATVLPSSA
jgi:broad specificity phosphatase PhoE